MDIKTLSVNATTPRVDLLCDADEGEDGGVIRHADDAQQPEAQREPANVAQLDLLSDLCHEGRVRRKVDVELIRHFYLRKYNYKLKKNIAHILTKLCIEKGRRIDGGRVGEGRREGWRREGWRVAASPGRS